MTRDVAGFMSESETKRSSSPKEHRTRRFIDFCIVAENSVKNKALTSSMKSFITFEYLSFIYASISLFAAVFLVVVPNISALLIHFFPDSSRLKQILSPFNVTYRTYCSLTLDPFICKARPGWMYAPLLIEGLIQIPLLKAYFYSMQPNSPIPVSYKRAGYPLYFIILFLKLLPVFLEIGFNSNIENKATLFAIYGIDLFSALLLEMASRCPKAAPLNESKK